MATIKAVVLKSKPIKGDRYRIRISVAHGGETRYILTNIILDSIKEFKNGQIVKRPDAAILNTKLRAILQRYQSYLDEIEYLNGLTCPEVVCLLLNGAKEKLRTIKAIYEEYVENSRISDGSKMTYHAWYTRICRELGESYLIEQLSCSTLMAMERKLRARNLSSSYIRDVMLFLSQLTKYAKRCGYVTFKIDPFLGYRLPKTHVRDSWLTVDDIKNFRDYDCSPNKNPGARTLARARARDVFMLSFYLGGMNIADMARINFKEQKGVIKYVRKKIQNHERNNKYVEFEIPEEAKEILDRLVDKDGYIVLGKSRSRDKIKHWAINYYLKIIGRSIGIPNLIFYSARKTFAQIAFNLGVNTAVIDYILGHSVNKGGTSLYSYIRVTPEMATKAIRLVLDNIK